VVTGRPAAYVLFSADRGDSFLGPWCFDMSRARAGWWGMHGYNAGVASHGRYCHLPGNDSNDSTITV
jgi:hypothetical protein